MTTRKHSLLGTAGSGTHELTVVVTACARPGQAPARPDPSKDRGAGHTVTPQAMGLEPLFAAGRRRDGFLEECSIEEVSQSPVEESTQPKTSRQYKSVLEELKTKPGSWVGREAGEFGKS